MDKARMVTRHAAVAMVLALAGLAACTPAGPGAAASRLTEGQPFPAFMLDFVAAGLERGQLPPGRLLVLNVWASWCGPCRREMPSLERLSARLDPQRYAVIGISTDADPMLAEEFLRQYGISFTNLLDRDGSAARELGMKVYPDTFIISPDGILLRRMTGLHEWDSAEIVALLESFQEGPGHPALAPPRGRFIMPTSATPAVPH